MEFSQYMFFIVSILWACRRSVTGHTMVLQCALGDPSLKWDLYIKSSLHKEYGHFAKVPQLDKRLYCQTEDCYALETNTSSFIKDNLASIFINDECAVSNGTTFSCVLLYRNLALPNVLGNETTITHSGNQCIPASLPPSTTPMIISTTTDKGDEGSVTTNATVPTTTGTPTSSVVSPSNYNLGTAKHCSIGWIVGLTVCVVIIVILGIVIVVICRRLRENQAPKTLPEETPLKNLNN